MSGRWCGVCGTYTSHDTAHHETGGDPAPGDIVTLVKPGDEWAHLKGKKGRVESVRAGDLTIAVPAAGGTVSIQVGKDAVE